MEIWKDIEGYEGLYQVSTHGRVRSLNYIRTKETRIMVPCKKPSGYLYVSLSKNSKRKNFYIHRLVAEAFIENNDNLPQINHRDEDKTNNNIDNLEWCDSYYNLNYGERNVKAGEKLMNGPCSKPVLQFTLEGEFVAEYPSTMEVKRLFGYNGISSCCRGCRAESNGFIFIYKEDYSEEFLKNKIEKYKYTQSKEYREKIAKKLTNGKASKPVVQLSMSGDFIAEYPSMKEVERKLGINQGSVSNCCCGRCKSVSGFKFQFGEKYIKEKGYIPLF